MFKFLSKLFIFLSKEVRDAFVAISKSLKLEGIVDVKAYENDDCVEVLVKATEPGKLIGVGGSKATSVKKALFSYFGRHSKFTVSQHNWYEDLS